jgi:ATP-binding cassette subfamily B protein IrtA
MRQNPNWQIIAPVQAQIRVAIILSVLSSLCTILLLMALAYLIPALLAQHLPQIYGSFMLFAGLTILAYVLRLWAFNQSHFAAFRLEAILRKELSLHLAQLPLGFISSTGSAAISKVLQQDVQALHAFVADATPLFARAYAAPLFTFAALLWFDWRMACIALAVLALGMLILSMVMKNHDEMNQAYHQARENVNIAVVEFVQAMPVVRTFDGGQKSFRRYQNALLDYRQILRNWYQQQGLTARISMLILNPLPTFVLLLIVGCYFWQQQSLPFEVLVASLLLGTGMVESLMPYMSLYHLVEKSKISAARLLELKAVKALPPPPFAQVPSQHDICFEAVDFAYPGRGLVLHNINFVAPAQQLTALVGASGAGKSTLAKLIPRFWDVSQGAIKIGGIDVKDMATQDLMNQVAFVFQENFLFSDSIANNIRLGVPHATEQQIQQAARLAQADEFIQQLSAGYHTQVGERGANLSGGQRQRITIARAILQNRPILILDEATAFADAENEALLIQALQHLIRNKTVIMIAHRLSSIQYADQILVIEQGQLLERGQHTDLLAANGRYAELWHAAQHAQHWHIASSNNSVAQGAMHHG